MLLPPGVTEESVLDAIHKVSEVLCNKFTFPDCDKDDVHQEIALHAIDLLNTGKYDPSRPLAPLLYRHASNRLSNRTRDRISRRDPPCKRCSEGDPCGPEGQVCDRFKKWSERNATKARLMSPHGFDLIRDEGERSMRLVDTIAADASASELSTLIDAELPLDLRADYLRLLDGVKVPAARRRQLQRAVLEILEEHGLTREELGLGEGVQEEAEQGMASAA